MRVPTRALVAACMVISCTGALAISCTGAPPPSVDGGAEDAASVCAEDADCDDGIYCNGAELCRPRAAEARANGCVPAPSARCLNGQVCNETAMNCTTDCSVTNDADGDGSDATQCGGDDCDDADPQRHPGNAEVCDERGHDEDCDLSTFGARDADRDGVPDATCCNPSPADPTMQVCGDDCDDGRRVVNPNTTEACDHFDNDCDGSFDEGVEIVGYVDEDRDGFGTGAGVMVCAGTIGYALDDGDCDDHDAAQRPMGAELCDGRDNDCDGNTDETPSAVTWYHDLDGDQFGSAASGTVVSCTPVAGYSLLGSDCDDHRAGINPAAAEACNGVDDDCNGAADFAVRPGDLEDDDADGFVDAACGALGDDCDDADPATHPGATEFCDGRDNDCNGTGDDLTAMIAWYADVDGDGWGDGAREPITSCVQPAGRVVRALDCDDTDPDRHPENVDGCDGRDQDCDAAIDEVAPRTLYWTGDVDGDGFAGGAPVASCMPIAGATTAGGDCDDTRADRAPGLPEACNGFDDDCDLSVDEGLGTITCGMAACVRTTPACVAGAPAICTPGTAAPETCNGLDDDCNGTIDDPTSASRACMLAHASSSCATARCRIDACDTGYVDCNNSAADGCEAHIDDDPLNCGACGRACGGGQSCRLGHCANDVVDLALGSYTSCALLGSGHVYCWGNNLRGQVGAHSTAPDYTTATEVTRCDGSGACPALPGALGLEAGTDTFCVWRDDGHAPSQRLVCWGDSASGQTGSTQPQPYFDAGTYNTSAFNLTITGVQMGPTWTLVRDSAGLPLYAAGHRESGVDALNCNHNESSSFQPTGGPPLVRVVDMHCGSAFCFARDASSTTATFVWGADPADVLGTGVTACSPLSADLGEWRTIAVGDAHACFVRTSTTDVVCRGSNASGQLGAGDIAPHLGTFVTTGTSGSVDIDAFGDTTCVINDGHEVACWGGNAFGQTGTAGPAPMLVPSHVPTSSPARLVGVGGHHACAVLETNQVVCWGDNSMGELGNGTHTSSINPVFVAGLP